MFTVNFTSFFSLLFWELFAQFLNSFFTQNFLRFSMKSVKSSWEIKHNLAVFPVFALLLRQVEPLGLQNHIHGCNEQVQRFKSHWIVP